VKQVDGRSAHMTDITRHQSWQSNHPTRSCWIHQRPLCDHIVNKIRLGFNTEMIDLIYDLCFCLGFYNFKMVGSSSHVYCFLGVWPKGELPTRELWFRRVMFKPRPLFPTTTPNFKLSRCFLELTYESYVWHNSLSLTLYRRKKKLWFRFHITKELGLVGRK
jgi:hypothetical protein